MLTKNLHNFSSFDLDRQIVQASIRAGILVSTIWPPTKERRARDKVLSIGNYIVGLVAARNSTTRTGKNSIIALQTRVLHFCKL